MSLPLVLVPERVFLWALVKFLCVETLTVCSGSKKQSTSGNTREPPFEYLGRHENEDTWEYEERLVAPCGVRSAQWE